MLHGVLDDTHIHYVTVDLSGKSAWSSYPVETSTIDHAGDLIDIGIAHRRSQLWIHPGSKLSTRIGASEDTFVTDAQEDYNLFPGELAPFMAGWKREGTREERERVEIVLPEFEESFRPLLNLAPKDLFTALLYMEISTGTPVKYTSGRTGIELLATLNDTHQRKPFISPCESDLTPFYVNQASELSWSRALKPDEESMLYLHEFDRRSHFLSACSGLLVGGKQLTYQVKPAFYKRVPGLYHVSLSGTSPFNGEALPHPFKGLNDTWVGTPLVQAAIECGYQVEILEGYVFEDYHTTFTPWYERLRDAKQALIEDTTRFKYDLPRKAALESVKLEYTRAIGLMGRERQKNEKSHWYDRPDWRRMIIDEANHRMLLTLMGLGEAVTSHFIGMWVDNLWFVSNNPNPYESVPGLPIASNIGKYKYEGTYPLQEVKHLITNQPHTLVTGLAQYDKEREASRYALSESV